MRVATALLALALAGCETAARVTIDATKLCETAWRQINVRPGDKLTEQTAQEIEGNNLAREGAGCKYQPPPRGKTATS